MLPSSDLGLTGGEGGRRMLEELEGRFRPRRMGGAAFGAAADAADCWSHHHCAALPDESQEV